MRDSVRFLFEIGYSIGSMAATNSVQLTGKERTCVFRDLDSGRILSFGISGCPPLNVPQGIRYETIVCFHASELDRYMNQYRQQHKDDEEQAAVRKLEREKAFRKSVRDGILARNSQLDRWNAAVNIRVLDTWDREYDRILKQKMEAIPRLVAEMYEEGGDQTRIVKDAATGAMAK